MRARLVSLVAPLLLAACYDGSSVDSPDAQSVDSSLVTQPSVPDVKSPQPPATVDEASKFATSNNAFGFDLYKRIKSQPGNLAMSPTSLSVALAMTWGGAKGATADEMKKVLRFEGTPADVMTQSGKMVSLLEKNDDLKVTFANRLFGEQTYKLEEPFLTATKNAYGAALDPVDFASQSEAARLRINGWVEGKTEKRIKDLIPEGGVDGDTRLALVNALYFLADWQTPFDKQKTRDATFQLSSKDNKLVPMMNSEHAFNYAEVDNAKLLELPYKGGQMSMLLALPNDVDGLAALEDQLASDKLGEWTRAMQRKLVGVSLPKFEINPARSLSLGDSLKAMGMPLAFTGAADFTGMANPPSASERLYISRVFHKAFVKVDEKGTEAAAASAVVMSRESMAAVPNTRFDADHPFVFMIRDNRTGLVLFMGRVADPSVK
jgi:serine protease inhibitor